METNIKHASNIMLIKSSPLSNNFLCNYICAYIQRSSYKTTKNVTIVQNEQDIDSAKRYKFSDISRHHFIQLHPFSANLNTKEFSPGVVEALKLYFDENKLNCNLLELLKTYDGMKKEVTQTLLQMSIEDFRHYALIYGTPQEIFNDVSILKCCYNFTIKCAKIWPKNLYIRVKDLILYLKSKNIIYSRKDLYDMSPKFLYYNDLICVTNFGHSINDEYFGKRIKFSECKMHENRRIEVLYDICWMYDKWIGHCPIITDKIIQNTINL